MEGGGAGGKVDGRVQAGLAAQSPRHLYDW